MIIKFDHISYVTTRDKATDILCTAGTPLFKELRLRNAEIKSHFMSEWQTDHDLYFYERDIPTEYIFYDQVNGNSRTTLNNGIITGLYYDQEEATRFLSSLFPNTTLSNNGQIEANMKGILDKRDVYLRLNYSSDIKPVFLNSEGYGIPAFIMKGDVDIPENCILTPGEIVTVNNRSLEIQFAGSHSVSVIFEFIRICT